MAITAACTHCNTTFSLRNEFAGKRIKCPKCKNDFMVPAGANAAGANTAGANAAGANAAGAKAQVAGNGAAGNRNAGGKPAGRMAAAASSAAASRGYNPLMDLLDEAGVQAKARGRGCTNCGAEIKPGAVLCIECGFNLETGERLSTAVLIDESDRGLADDLSDAEKRMARAEKEIDEMPVSSFGQDFGEGKESFLIALIAGISLLIFTAIGVACVLLMDKITEYVQPALISFIAAVAIYIACTVWLTALAFMVNTGHGAGCLLTGGLYGIIFGFMQGGGAILPTIIMLASILIGIISALFAFSEPTPDYSWIQSAVEWMANAPAMLWFN